MATDNAAARTINTTLGTGFGTRFSEVHDEAGPVLCQNSSPVW
jgi:hypothetical protein